MLTMCFFGSPTLAFDEHFLEVDTRKAIALLAYMCATNRPHSRESIATLLWPDYPQARALANLRRTLWTINKQLPLEVLNVDRQTIAFQAQIAAQIDVISFNTVLSAIQKVSVLEPTHIEQLCEAIALYRDDFLAGWHLEDSDLFEEWRFLETESFRAQVTAACEMVVKWSLEHQAYEQAIMYGRRWLAFDPLHEPAHRQLMLAYYRSGQRSAALRQYEECVRVLEQDLGVSPMEETIHLYTTMSTQVSTHSLHDQTPTKQPKALPGAATPFVGRQHELAEIQALLTNDEHCRLVTIVGPGGAGKTRLSIEVASTIRAYFADDVVVVALAGVESHAMALIALANALEITLAGAGEVEPQLVRALAAQSCLIIWDNAEHIPGFAALISRLLGATTNPKMLVTSRERLALPEEWLIDIAGLEVPPTQVSQPLETYAAAALFLQSARRVNHRWQLQASDHAAIIDICRTLEGFPLAIDLAAAWMRVLSCKEIAAEIHQNLDFLTSSLQQIPERHRSLRAVFEHSWSLLTPEEQRVLVGLAVFVGRFTREAATAVGHGALPMLLGLAGKSLLVRYDDGMFGLHDLIRQYARQKGVEQPEQAQVLFQRYADYYLEFAQLEAKKIASPQRTEGLKQVERQHDNVRAALHWFIEQRQAESAIKLATAMWQYWWVRGQHREGRRFLELVLADHQINDQVLLANAYKALAVLAWSMADYPAAEHSFLQALELFQYLEDDRSIGVTLSNLAGVLLLAGNYAKAADYYERALLIMRELKNDLGVAIILSNQAAASVYSGQFVRGEALARESMALFEKLDNYAMSAPPRYNLGLALIYLEQLEDAQALIEEALRLWRDQMDKPNIILALESLAHIAVRFNDLMRGATLIGAAEQFRVTIDLPRSIADQKFYEETCALLERTDNAKLAQYRTFGADLDWEIAMAYALQEQTLDYS